MKNKLAKLIEILPWLTMNQGSSVAQIAQHFMISEKDVLDLLQLAVLTGPGQFGGELVDIDFEDAESIFVKDAKGLTRPIKFTAEQGLQIISGLHYLAQLPGVIDNTVLNSLQMKFRQALGIDQTAIEVVKTDSIEHVLNLINRSIAENMSVRIEYASKSQGIISARLVDPKKIVLDNDISYVSAWCHAALAYRLFRVDRIIDCKSTDVKQVDIDSNSDDLARLSTMIEVEILASKSAFLEFDPDFIIDSEIVDPKSYRVKLNVHNLNWITREILASAGQISALAPQELVQLVEQKKNKWRELNQIH